MSDSVGQYLNEIGLVPLLTAADERELSQIIERGRAAADRKLEGERSHPPRSGGQGGGGRQGPVSSVPTSASS